MSDIAFRTYMTVALDDHMGDDAKIARIARVSTKGGDAVSEGIADAGLIRFLMRNRHGSPFEHATMTFYVEAPIFVWREIMRHRIASYNEESGRYRELEGVFYVPSATRPLQQIGKAGAYEFVPGTAEQAARVDAALRATAEAGYDAYRGLLADGVAREVARMGLPLHIYSRAFITLNARSLMNFLSLRVKDDDSMFPSYPQREIEMVAEQMEADFADLFPATYAAFVAAGRVAP